MKTLKITLALLASISILSCSSDDEETTEDLTGETGSVTLKFDNSVNGDDFIFGTEYSRSNGETYTINTLKYIVSNITLTKDDGTVFEYSDDSDIFIVDEADTNDAGEYWITLDGIDAADYTSITFGIGVDQERYSKGADGQGDFLAEAEAEEMTWAWAMGYKFFRVDGSYGPLANDTDSDLLSIHMGSIGETVDNYQDVTLALPNTILVREDMTPEVHIVADIAKVFDGVTSLNFANGDSEIHGGEKTTIVANNINTMFTAHHVHNQ